MSRQYYAHSKEGVPLEDWQTLEKHLCGVAQKCHCFSEKFRAGVWGEAAGLLHDAGKYSPEFQAYLRQENNIDDPDFRAAYSGRVPHAILGARHLIQKLGLEHATILLAYLIAGHHRGLQDGSGSGKCSLKNQLDSAKSSWTPDADLPPWLLPDIKRFEKSPLHFSQEPSELKKRGGFQIALFARMLYSCLVDADSLDTEAFVDYDAFYGRQGYPSLQTLSERFRRKMRHLTKSIDKTMVNRVRDEIHAHCIAAAAQPSGLFSLTVPTGGGKTLSSLGFALAHAEKHDLDRIIYAIPFTSIIEQNAQVFRKFLGCDAVLEHHCNFDPDKVYSALGEDEEDVSVLARRARLATENWDAPLVVTTNVQLFNSLMSNRRSRCRKLHNLCRSVIVLDEAQALPPEHLLPCLESLRELAANYGCSIVLCTATQPALEKNEDFPEGLDGVREIIPRPEPYFDQLQRVEIRLCDSMRPDNDPLTDAKLCEQLADHPQALVVVNTRKHARLLFEQLYQSQCPKPCEENRSVFHLSAAMCPAHRSEQLVIIKERLKKELPCKVISTQLIEAGVDIDFPVVYRAETGIDSLAQSAGRCNREGRLNEQGRLGQVTLFRSEHGLPVMGGFRQKAQSARETIKQHADNLLAPDAVNNYFNWYYWGQVQKDGDGIMGKCYRGWENPFDFPFEEMGRFSLINEDTRGIYIPFNEEARRLLEKLRYTGPSRDLMGKLQQFTVAVYANHFSKLISGGAFEEIYGCFALQQEACYSPFFGLLPELAGSSNPETFFVGD